MSVSFDWDYINDFGYFDFNVKMHAKIIFDEYKDMGVAFEENKDNCLFLFGKIVGLPSKIPFWEAEYKQ